MSSLLNLRKSLHPTIFHQVSKACQWAGGYGNCRGEVRLSPQGDARADGIWQEPLPEDGSHHPRIASGRICKWHHADHADMVETSWRLVFSNAERFQFVIAGLFATEQQCYSIFG